MTPVQLAVWAILSHASVYDWSVQGFGVLRLYIGTKGRLHLWDSALRYPGVSLIHNHSWDLSSTVVAGHVRNVRYSEDANGSPYLTQRLITGYQTRMVTPIRPTRLYEYPVEDYQAGDVYRQLAAEIHRTDADDGTITLMTRQEDTEGQADVYWPAGTEWGTAAPRLPMPGEVLATVTKALRVLLR